ncbi:TPA: hypothetical protein HA246_01070 [Candidatus Woesearchaeota archaeon]|nr:hypothetical protein [Candidatus Woesearchaeota archaeon]
MAFIRIKKIKGIEYAYIVENSWQENKVRQKVKKYLGKVYKFERKKFENEEHELTSFIEFVSDELEHYLAVVDSKKILLDIVRWELNNHGFKQDEKNIQLWKNEVCRFNEKLIAVTNDSKADVTFGFNDGLLNTFKLRKLLRLNYAGEEQEVGYKIAKDLVELGLKVPKELFIGLFQKMY